MNKETFPATGDNDFDRPPEQELVTLFASCVRSARPVDVETLLTLAETVRLPFFHWRNPMLRRVAALLLATSAVVAVTAWLTYSLGQPDFIRRGPGEGGQTRSVMYKLGRKRPMPLLRCSGR